VGVCTLRTDVGIMMDASEGGMLTAGAMIGAVGIIGIGAMIGGVGMIGIGGGGNVGGGFTARPSNVTIFVYAFIIGVPKEREF